MNSQTPKIIFIAMWFTFKYLISLSITDLCCILNVLLTYKICFETDIIFIVFIPCWGPVWKNNCVLIHLNTTKSCRYIYIYIHIYIISYLNIELICQKGLLRWMVVTCFPVPPVSTPGLSRIRLAE